MGIFIEIKELSSAKGRKYLAERMFVRNIKYISNVGLIGQRLIPYELEIQKGELLSTDCILRSTEHIYL